VSDEWERFKEKVSVADYVPPRRLAEWSDLNHLESRELGVGAIR